MLATKAVVTDEVEVSERDIDRTKRAMKGGTAFAGILPLLSTDGTSTTTGKRISLAAQSTKRQGEAVRYVGDDDPVPTAVVREVNLHKKFHM